MSILLSKLELLRLALTMEAEQEQSVMPLFFMDRAVITDRENLTTLDVCEAAANVIDSKNVVGAQKIQNVWRIYIHNTDSRNTLLQTGIDLLGQHVDLSTENPAKLRSMANFRGDLDENGRTRPINIKVMIRDVHYSIPNDKIKDTLEELGAELKSPVRSCYIRDKTGNLTNYIDGTRFTYAESKQLEQHPLPRFAIIGQGFMMKITYNGQPNKDMECSKCLSKKHMFWECNNSRVCRVCKNGGHVEGDILCPYSVTNNGCYTFGGRKDVFGLSNFNRCVFTYNENKFRTREHAIQYEKAKLCGRSDLCELIKNASTPAEAKAYTKCITDTTQWTANNFETVKKICYEATCQVEEYRNSIIETGDQLLVEAITGVYEWSSGLNHEVTKRTLVNKFPGENKMGMILMILRDEINEENKPEEAFGSNSESEITDDQEEEYDSAVDHSAKNLTQPTMKEYLESKNSKTPRKKMSKRKSSRTPVGSKDRKMTKGNESSNKDHILDTTHDGSDILDDTIK